MSAASEKPGSGPAPLREISPADLPLHCPPDDVPLWSMHPRVYLPIEATGEATCPYCGARYVLRDRTGG